MVLSLIKVKESITLFDTDHAYFITLFIHLIAGRIGYAILAHTQPPTNGMTIYFTVVTSMASVWLGVSLLRILITALNNFRKTFHSIID